MKILIFFVCVLLSSQLSALIINIPDDFTTIQEGIQQSSDGDTVLVYPGTYYENLNLLGKSILLSSHFLLDEDTSFIEQTIIDGSNFLNPDTTSTIICCNNETESTTIQGFTITGGCGTLWIDPQFPASTWFSGGGIFIYYSSPTIRYNNIQENIVINTSGFDGASGGGLLCFRGNPTIINNSIFLNQAEYGAGVVVDYSGAIIKNNLVVSNTGGQLYGGGGFYFIGNDTNPIIVENNTIFGNHSETSGGAMRMWNSNVSVLNSIIWNNTQIIGGPIYQAGGSSITYCDIEEGFTGEGNIDLEPQFIDNESFILDENSPCIDAGNPDPIYNDPENTAFPGQAHYPCHGTILNDLGLHGGPAAACFLPVSIENNTIPFAETLLKNYPNPFNPTTTILFSTNELRKSTKLVIYNLKGQKVKSFLIDQSINSITWNGTDDNNHPVASGIYYLKMKIGESSIAHKLLLLR